MQKLLLLYYYVWNVSSLRQMAFIIFHDSLPYSSVVRTLLLKKRSLVFKLIFLLAFPDVLDGGKRLPCLEEPCIDF